MSTKISTKVFFSKAPPFDKLVLLCMADTCGDEGENSYQSVRTIAKKTSLTPRGVRKILRRLQKAGCVFAVGTHTYKAKRPGEYDHETVNYTIAVRDETIERLLGIRGKRVVPAPPARKVSAAPERGSSPPLNAKSQSAEPRSSAPRNDGARNAERRSSNTKASTVQQSLDINQTGARSASPSQDTKSVPVETVQKPSGPTLISKVASEKTLPRYSKDPIREQMYRGIFTKKIENAIFDCRRDAFPVMFKEAATAAALTLCSNRARTMMNIDHREIAAMVVHRCAPGFATLQAVSDYDTRVIAIRKAVVNATIDAAIELRRKRPHPQLDMFATAVSR